MRIVHITATTHLPSGRMAADLCRMARKAGHQELFCYGSGPAPSGILSLQVGDTPDLTMGLPSRRSDAPLRMVRKLTRRLNIASANAGIRLHKGLSRITGRSGFYSAAATQRLIQQLDAFAPDVIHLHDLHGFYLHLPTLFDYLQDTDIPVVWTLHDLWPLTGHCVNSHLPIDPYQASQPDSFAAGQCLLWQSQCGGCPLRKTYPASLLDQSGRNFAEKKELFTRLTHLTLTAPSQWLHDRAARSFLREYPIHILPIGLDLTRFKPCADERHMQDIALFYGLDRLAGRRMVLSLCSPYDDDQELDHLCALAELLGDEYCVVAAGLTQRQIETLPGDMLGLPLPANPSDLCVLYTAADCCVCLRPGEACGISLVEAMACGTQVLAYQTAALPEVVTPQVGQLVPTGDLAAATDGVRSLCDQPKDPLLCIAQAARFGSNLRYEPYLKLYEQVALPWQEQG